MCRWIEITGWACGCQLRPSYHINKSFIKRCPKSINSGTGLVCVQLHTYPTKSKIPALCHQCQDQVVQNQFRALYGLTGSTVDCVKTELDRTDIDRDILVGSDLGIRNQLEANLNRLQANIIVTVRKFNELRDTQLEGFFGIDNFCHFGLDKIADNGQLYAFLPHDQQGQPSMLTEGERQEKDLPIYETELVRNPYILLDRGTGDAPPDYLDVYPYNNLDTDFRPQDLACNQDAISEGASSESSDYQGQGVTDLQVLRRLRLKLRAELDESKEMDKKAPGGESLIKWAPMSLVTRHKLAFGSLFERRERRQQLRMQLHIISIWIEEQDQLIAAHKKLVSLRVSVMNGDASKSFELSAQRDLLCMLVSEIYQNRLNHSLSEILVPLNGTDPSVCHSIGMLPASHKTMFAPRVFGFPASTLNQLVGYNICPGAREFPRIEIDHAHSDWFLDEKPGQNSDVKENGSIIETPELLQRFEQMRQKNMASKSPQQHFVPVTKLKRYPVDVDNDAPTVRIVRHPDTVLAFQIVLPNANPLRPAPLPRTNSETPVAPLRRRWDEVRADIAAQSIVASTPERTTSVPPTQTLMLRDLMTGARATMRRAAARTALPSIMVGTDAPHAARISVDLSDVDPQTSRIVTYIQTRQRGVLLPNDPLLLLVELVLPLDGVVVSRGDARLGRICELVVGHNPFQDNEIDGIPPRPDSDNGIPHILDSDDDMDID